jgi:RimJ/RimL family protein N-acetyltransferase
MLHSLEKEMFGVRLRPVRMDDAAFIVWLRNLDYVKGKIGDSACDEAGQRLWLASYFEREGDYYFIIETLAGIPLGTHSLYDVAGGGAELGRWVIRPGVQAAVPSHMAAFEIAFEVLKLDSLRNATVSTNTPVLSISRRFGFEQVDYRRGERIIGGRATDMVHFILTRSKWAEVRGQIVPKAEIAEGLVKDWEKAQMALAPGEFTKPTRLVCI